MEFVINGEIELLKLKLDEGLDVNSAYANNQTLLSLAVVYKKLDIVKLLLSRGANPNIEDIHGQRPISNIYHGSIHDRRKIAKELLFAGAELNFMGWMQITPLVKAIRNYDYEMIILFLEKGADVNYPYYNFIRPLNEAVILGCPEIFKLLLSRGADPNGIDCFGEHPLIKTTKINLKLTNILLDNGSVPQLSDKNFLVTTILMQMNTEVSKQENIEILGKLLSVGPKVSWSNSTKQLAEDLKIGYLFSNIRLE